MSRASFFLVPKIILRGHKFGLSYVGVGWVVWRDKAHLPKDLIFELHYLGSIEYSFSLNFSRPAAPIIAQYFNFVHLGFEGYRRVALDDLKNARLLSRALEKSGYYYVLSDAHRQISDGNLTGIAKQAIGIDEEDVEVSEYILTLMKHISNDCCRVTHLLFQSFLSGSLMSSRENIRIFSRNGCKRSCVPRAGTYQVIRMVNCNTISSYLHSLLGLYRIMNLPRIFRKLKSFVS